MGAPAIAAILARREKEVVNVFRAAGATSSEKAQSYTAIGLGESMALKRLRNRAVIREAAPGRYYLDEEVWAAVRRTRWRVGTVMVSILALLLLGILLGIIKW
ncbi:MAG TPA: hypothetical protein VK494_01655 [Gemmatimonadaceae bacterium]|jgi:hypothetical protein|nr:hypothetical protein [Gemmatimonadaceae bacterium]